MMKRNRRRSAAVWIALVLVAALAGWFYWRGMQPESDVIVREREYSAAMGDITVCVNIAGSISGKTQEQHGYVDAELGGYMVDKGDRVKQGDVIAKYDTDRLTELLSEAMKKYDEVRKALDEVLSARADDVNALVSRLSSDKRISKSSYKAYDKYFKNLKERLDDERDDIKSELHRSPDDAELSARLDAIDAEIERISAAQAALKAAREEVTEHESDVLAQTEADIAASELIEQRIDIAEKLAKSRLSEVNAIKNLLDNPEVRAECDGVVLELGYEAGDEVGAKPIVTCSTQRGWRMKFNAEQENIPDIEIGQQVELYANAYPTELLTGKVERISGLANDEGKFEVEVSIDDAGLELMDGMTCYGTAILTQKKNVLTLSNKAIAMRDGAQYVLVRDAAGELAERQITTGFSDGRISEVLDGLSEGDVVVVVDEL